MADEPEKAPELEDEGDEEEDSSVRLDPQADAVVMQSGQSALKKHWWREEDTSGDDGPPSKYNKPAQPCQVGSAARGRS